MLTYVFMPVAEKNLILQQKMHVGYKVFYIRDESRYLWQFWWLKKETGYLVHQPTTTGGGPNCMVLN
jgi:hypothetical protein